MNEEEWNVCPTNWTRNFKCVLKDSGLWRLEEQPTWGKWLFLIEPIGVKTCPGNGDHYNFITGILEAENRNDKFRIEHGSKPQKQETLRKFEKYLKEVKEKWQKEDNNSKLGDHIGNTKTTK